MLSKIKDKKGSAGPLVMGIFLILLLVTQFVGDFKKNNFENVYKKCSWGMETGTKTALTRAVKKDIEIGFLEDTNKYNQYFKLNHAEAIKTFFECYYSSIGVDSSTKILENATTIAIVEPDTAEYKVTIYKNGSIILNNSYTDIKEIERSINARLANTTIKLFNNDQRSIVNLENKTYLIAVTEDLKLTDYEEFINISYFEGSNLNRNINMRGDK